MVANGQIPPTARSQLDDKHRRCVLQSAVFKISIAVWSAIITTVLIFHANKEILA